MTSIDIEAFVLIGGRSSRLGEDKAFIELGGMTLAERSARIIEAAFANVPVRFVAGADGQFPVDVLAGLARPMIADLRPGFGAWSGLHAALAYTRGEWALVLACDYPFVPPELIRLLAGFATDDNNAVLPVQPDGRLQPLCALYRVKPFIGEIEGLMERAEAMPPLRVFLDRPLTRRVEAHEYAAIGDPERLFLNINTPADLAKLGHESQES